MGLKPHDLVQADEQTSDLGGWYANLLLIDRRKCVLFVNDKTLFNFLVPAVTKPEIKQLGVMFRNWFQCLLAEEGFDADQRSQIMQDYAHIKYANTNSKQVLGSMNELVFMYKYHIEDEGGIYTPAMPQIIHKMNRVRMGQLKGKIRSML